MELAQHGDDALNGPASRTGLADGHSSNAEAGPSSTPDPPPGYRWYLHHLDDHILSSHHHLTGHQPPAYSSIRLPKSTASQVPPTDVTWSSREKALFFSALSRHSRFRTDLIAGDVSSKSEAEVEWYLALLQSGAESVRRTDGSIVGRRDRRARWRGSHRWTEGRAGAAREVSGRWVEREEELGWAVERDLCCREGDVAAREKEESRRRERREALRAAGIARSDRSGSKIPVITFELERRWALEDWGEEVDVEKLREMDRLHIPEWSQWYRDRLDPAPKDDCPVGKKRKLKNIEDETEILQTISNIPKRLRTADDKAQLALAVNRKRSREKYRVKKLLEGGMSQGEIDLAGGADAVFALQAQEGGGEVKVKKEAPRRRELSREEDREGSRSLKSLGVDRRMQEAGWVFNYDRMAQLAQLFLKSDDVAFSFTIFEGLHQELLGYLTSVLYHVITLAEQSPAQTGGTQEISPDHVHQALSLRGETHPGITLAKYLHRISEEIDDSGMSTTKRSHLEQYVDPPGKVSWWQMPLAGACPFPGEEDMLAEDDGDSTTSEDSSEEEDDQLDEAIDELDMAYDALLETALWDAVERDQPMKMDDMDDPWEAGPAGSSSGTVEMEKAKNARMAYERIRKDTSKARRQRHIAKHRSTKFPTTRLRKLSRRERKIRSAAVVVDSSDEEVREGEGSGESEEGGGTEASDEEDEEEEEDWSAHDTSEEEEVDGYERGLER